MISGTDWISAYLFYSHTFIFALFPPPPPQPDPSFTTRDLVHREKGASHGATHSRWGLPSRAWLPFFPFHKLTQALALCGRHKEDKIMAMPLKTSWSNKEKATYLTTCNIAQQRLWTKYVKRIHSHFPERWWEEGDYRMWDVCCILYSE